MTAIYAPFPQNGSSNSNMKPDTFEWTSEDSNIQVLIDWGMLLSPQIPKRTDQHRYGWVCESSAIVAGVIDGLIDHKDQIFQNGKIKKIYTCDDRLLSLGDDRFEFCFACSNLPWIKEHQLYEKTKLVSMVASAKHDTAGHKKRHEFAKNFKDQMDLFGGAAGSNREGDNGTPWPDKLPLLQDYMFNVVVENDSYPTYFTEKITDCFATGTVPVYWGCPTIGEYFNEDGIILVDDDFDISVLTKELYESKIDAIKDNFERVNLLIGSDDYLYELIMKDISNEN